ncbi:MAG: hypothetical protein IJQ85_00880 [Selenomonadaceae bacterium]|nr:hypothetical protein [Selenomonadaceae bacterium]
MSSSLINRTNKKIQARGKIFPALLRCPKEGFNLREIFSDSARGKFPKNQSELTARLKSIERCINNNENLREVNVEFCKRSFRLLADCGLINEDNVRFLSSAEACENYDPKLKFPYNRSQGVLRKVKNSDDIYDAKNIQRFYHESNMCVLCGGQEYFIANNLFADGEGLLANKRAFYNWLVLQIQKSSIEDELDCE